MPSDRHAFSKYGDRGSWYLLIAGVLLTAAVAWALERHNLRLLRDGTEKIAATAEDLIKERFEFYEYGLRGARGAVVTAGVDTITRAQFQAYSASRDVAREFPGAMGFGFIRRVPAAQEQTFLARARADGAPNFSIRTLTPHDGDRFVIQYIYPEAGNSAATGLDIASEVNRRTAALAAAAEDQPKLTAPITLVQADGKPRRGFLILMPVYARDQAVRTAAELRKAVRGWSYAPLLVDQVLADLGPSMNQVALTLSTPGENKPFYTSHPGRADTASPVMVTRDIRLMGQLWTLEVRPLPVMEKDLKLWSYWWAIWLGLALTGMAVLIRGVSQGARELALQDSGLQGPVARGDGRFLDSAEVRRRGPIALVVLGLAFTLGSWQIIQEELARASQRLEQDTTQTLELISAEESTYRRDVQFLASVPSIPGLTRALTLPGGASVERWKDELAGIFQAYMQATPDAFQVRLIRADATGQELLKIVRESGRTRRVDERLLQPKGNTAYMEQSLQMLKPGKTYVSDINLNREYGAVERPHRPTWRFIAPVYGQGGALFAVAVINVDVSDLLRQITRSTSDGAQLYLLNEAQDFLRHPDPSRAFAFEFGPPYRWRDAYSPASGTGGFGLTSLKRWDTGRGEVWSSEARFQPVDQPQSNGIHIVATMKRVAVFSTIALYLAGLTLSLGAVGGLAILWQFRVWELTRRRLIEEKLARSEAIRQNEYGLFKALVDSAPDATIIVDANGVIQLVNAQAERMFGYNRTDLVGHPVHRLLPPHLASTHQAHVATYSQQPVARSMGQGKILRAMRSDGTEIPVEISLGPVQLEDRLLTAAAVRDITERLAADEKLHAALRQAEHATQAKSAFLANTSHEIRTPLNAIIGLTHLLADDELTQAQGSLVQKIQIAGRGLLGIVNDVLDLAKIEADEMSVNPGPVDLRELLEELGSVFTPQAEVKGLQFRLEPDASLPDWVITDRLRLHQILTNLIGNALKFTPTGSIQVQARVEPDGPAPAAGGGLIRISVTDTGIGISAAAQERLFQPFSQADSSTTRRFGGTGLGLSIVRKLAQLLGGDAGVQSNEGVGSSFWVTLPLNIPTPQEIAGLDTGSTALTVLIAEDDPEDSRRLQQLARSLGWRVQAVSDGATLVQAFIARKNQGFRQPDALIVDWQMPQMDGLQALSVLAQTVGREELPAVLVVSAHEKESIAKLDRDRLVGRILHKPIESSELFNAINDVVTSRTGDTRRVLQATRTEVVKARWLPGVRVLVVDDSSINLDVVAQILRRNGAVVTTADSGESALAILQTGAQNFDAVLMDVQMPRMDGLEATQRVRKELGLKDLPVLALTAGALVEERRRALDAGMNDFLTKPVDPSQLINRLRAAVERYRNTSLGIEAPVKLGEDQPEDWPTVPGLDTEKAKRLLGGDRRLFLYTMSRLLEEHGNLASDPPANIDTAQADELRLRLAAQVHKLRSASGTIGADRLHQLASSAENLLRKNQPAHSVLSALSKALVTLRETSTPVLAAWRADEESQLLAADSTAQPLQQEQLRELLTLVSTNNLAALEWAQTHRDALGATLGPAGSRQLLDHLDRLEFDQAGKLLTHELKDSEKANDD